MNPHTTTMIHIDHPFAPMCHAEWAGGEALTVRICDDWGADLDVFTMGEVSTLQEVEDAFDLWVKEANSEGIDADGNMIPSGPHFEAERE
jgi:hypothetical protein